jgi:hypothetical protein
VNVRRFLPRLSRPVAVIAAVVVGLGGLGGATGAVLGGLGAVGAVHGEHHHDRFGGPDRFGTDGDGGPLR